MDKNFKWAALAKFGGDWIKPKHVYEMIKEEVCHMIKAWKKDKFATVDPKSLVDLNDADFMTAYNSQVYETVQHEAAEAIDYIMKFMEAHGVDIMPHVDNLRRKRLIDKGISKVAAKAVNVMLPPR